ncbi:MAG: hypothetical protein K0Q95_831 [Bacteroidota bacterium]|jgi:hypothetical protein|nr:hypothetical protein [Bacteroidota bacterium]
MKHFIKVLSVLVIVVLIISFVADDCKVNYNGIYTYKIDEEHSAVLRFYEDKTVLASTSTNDYMDVMSWFNKENKEMVLKGSYSIKGSTIKFKVSGMTGEQNYEGEIAADKINFNLKNKDSKKGINRTYTFIAL